MPTYEYLCQKCEHRFEIVQKITADSLTDCPECDGAINRVVFPVGLVFKGTGFYVTDYGASAKARRDDAKAGKEAAEAATSSASDSSDSSGDKKSSSASETKSSESKSAKKTTTAATD